MGPAIRANLVRDTHMDNASSPKKTVRFNFSDQILEQEESDDEDREERPRRATSYRSPPPPVPSPTFSGSTESSTGPITPPSPFYTPLTDSKFPSSPLTPGPVIPKLNPALSAFAALMRWNMDEDPTDTLARYELEDGMEEAASLPPGVHLDQMKIVHEEIPDWPLIVEKDIQEESLSVKQVMFSLHTHFVKMVKEEHVMAQLPKRREMIINSYRRRPTNTVAEGVRRIDYLPNRTFLGLRAQEYDDAEGIWVFSLIFV